MSWTRYCLPGLRIDLIIGDPVSQPGHCPSCGYDLRGIKSQACPECGAIARLCSYKESRKRGKEEKQ